MVIILLDLNIISEDLDFLDTLYTLLNSTCTIGVSNHRRVWNKRKGQVIFQKKINTRGFHTTVQYRANKRTGQDFSWK